MLEKVPGLSSTAKANIRKFVSDKKMGKHNDPRAFSNDELAQKGIVSNAHSLYNIALIISIVQVPKEYSKLKAVKCTIIVADAFSTEMQKQLEAGEYECYKVHHKLLFLPQSWNSLLHHQCSQSHLSRLSRPWSHVSRLSRPRSHLSRLSRSWSHLSRLSRPRSHLSRLS